jgi:hypothetical protein
VLEDPFSGHSHQQGGGQLEQVGPNEPSHPPQQALLQLAQGVRGTDERLWTFLHQDWYQTMLYSKTSPVVKHQFVYIDYRRANKDMHLNGILEACDLHGITDKKERISMWMTNGRRFHVKLSQFAQILGLSSQLDIPKKLHSGRVMMPWEMTLMYIPNSNFQAHKVDGLLPHFLTLHRMMRKTLALRIGYFEAIPAYEWNLLDALMKPVHFDIF